MSNQFTGPDTHVSLDKTTHEATKESHPKNSYPSYRFHATKDPIVINSSEEEDALEEGWKDVPFDPSEIDPEVVVPDELDEMNRKDLADFGNLKYGLDLKGNQSKEALIAAIKEAQDKAAE